MPEIKDLIQKLREFESQIPEMLSRASLSVASDGIAIAQTNIQDKGFGEIYQSEEYMDYRASLGHQTEFVDLTLSAKMWNGMQPSEVVNEGWKYFCTVSNNTTEGVNKMNYNYERYGDFIGKALKDEVDTLREIAVETIFNYIEELGI